MARLRGIAPQNDTAAFGRAARLQFDDPAVRQFYVARRIFAEATRKLRAAMSDIGVDAAGEVLFSDLATGDLEANQVFISLAQQCFACGQGGENVMEMCAAE